MAKKYNGEHMVTNKTKPVNSVLTKKQLEFFSFLKEYLHEKGYPPTVREIMQGLGLSSTNSIKKHLDILERKGYIRRQHNSPRAIEIVGTASGNPEFRSIPVVGRIRAGVPHPVVEDIEGYLSLDQSICRSNDTFLLRVVGDSMIDAHIQEGDLVLVKPLPVADNGDIVVALIDGEATLKRFYRKGDTIHLKPEHPAMKPIVISEGQADVHIIGKVTIVIRQLEK
ncbi:MAG: transcriptional repressor LexA [Candidatus Brocadiaceae baterium WH-1]|nr:MAG: transcriptional repressor LexA [Candidatus Jettenia sp. AMX2]